MKNKKDITNKNKQNSSQNKDEEIICEEVADNEETATGTVDEAVDKSIANEETEKLKSQLDEKTKQCEEFFNMLQRTAAEFDNYKKRTAKEKGDIYADTVSEVVASFLPVVDNIERALQASANEADFKSLKEGIELVYRQFKEIMGKNGVEEIKAVGEEFDHNLHNAVMHVEDPECGQNVVVEEFQKGYMLKDKVIRYSMVKVAN